MENKRTLKESSFVEVNVAEIELKVCTKCHTSKEKHKDFYICMGVMRGECKKCTIRRNVKYQQKIKPWINRFVDGDETRSYMAEYKAKNPEKFVQYRKTFKEKHPNYGRDQALQKKQKKMLGFNNNPSTTNKPFTQG